MKHQMLVVAAVAGLFATMPVKAGAVPAAASLTPQPSLIQPVAYGDLPTSGARHRGRKSKGPIVHDPDPTLPDLHGATREQADKAYRKQYGF